MFGIGVSELLVILVLAAIFLGPEKMIEFAGQLGRWVSKFRAQTSDVTREFREAFDLELGDLRNEVTEVKRDIEGLKDVRDTLAAPLETPAAGTQHRGWRQDAPARPAFNMPTQAPTSGPAAGLAGPSAAAPAARAAESAAGMPTSAATAAVAAAAAPQPPPQAPAPEPEIVRDLSPNAEPIEISVGVMMGAEAEAEALELGGPVLMEDPFAQEAPAKEEGGDPAKDAGEEV